MNNAIEVERARLDNLFKDADPNKREFINNKLDELAWYNVKIAELQRNINECGTVEEYQNGANQFMLKKHPDCDNLVQFQKLSNAIFSKLLDVLPDDPKADKSKFASLMQSFDDDANG